MKRVTRDDFGSCETATESAQGAAGEGEGVGQGPEVGGFINFDEFGGKEAVAEFGFTGLVEGEEGGTELGDIGGGQGGAHGDDVAGDGALGLEPAELGAFLDGKVFVEVEHIVAHGGGLGLAGEDALDSGNIAGAVGDVAATEKGFEVGIVGDKAALVEVADGDDEAGGAGAAGEGDGAAAKIGDGLVRGGGGHDPVAVVGGAAVGKLPGEEDGAEAARAGVDHISRAEVTEVDGTVGQALEDSGGGEGDDDLDGAVEAER